MTDPDAPDPINPDRINPDRINNVPEDTPERVRIDEPPPRKRRDFLPLLYLLGFLVLGGSLFYLYKNPSTPPGVVQEAERVDTLQQQIEALTGRLNAVEQSPTSAPGSAAASQDTASQGTTSQAAATQAAPAQDIAPLEARIAALEPRLAALEPKLAALEPKLAASESKSSGMEPQIAALDPRLSTLETRLSALEARPAPPPPPPVDFGPINARLDSSLSKQSAELSKQTAELKAQQAAGLKSTTERLNTGLQGLASRLDTVEGRMAAVEKQGSAISGQLGGIAERAQRVTRIQTAMAALEAGQKLGDIPAAPPALARFATEAPPTEAALRKSFNNAAEAAQHASQPAIMDNQPLAARLWTRAQQSVSVRQGDRVLLGDPVSGILAHAREALDAGDLAGAVSALNGLAGPAAAAMADWTGQARALLEARAALATMAGRG